jgi:hypothetical protein
MTAEEGGRRSGRRERPSGGGSYLRNPTASSSVSKDTEHRPPFAPEPARRRPSGEARRARRRRRRAGGLSDRSDQVEDKIILAKIEGTYGTDPVPTGGANAILMTDVELKPMEGQDVSRNIERPYLGAQEEIPCRAQRRADGLGRARRFRRSRHAPAWGPLCAPAALLK